MFGAPKVVTDEAKIDMLLSRAVDEVIPGKEEIKKLLMSGRRLRVKLGIDPTSPNLHLGRSVPLLKLKDFQDLGHQAILIVGDATGVVGDTSDKKSERPMLSRVAVKKNAETYFAQAATILEGGFERRYNSNWLDSLSFAELGEMANEFSVAEFIARDNISRRLAEGTRVSLRETLYPLMQGYDSVAVKSDIEIGGVDQRFNLLAGRTLQAHYKQTPQGIVTTQFPIEGLDGRKMSSSWGNTIAFTETPNEMFGKVMSITDDLVEKYFQVLTRVPLEQVEEYVAGHPKEAKLALAEELVRMYHGKRAARKAKEGFIEIFSKGGVPEHIQTVSKGGLSTTLDVLVRNEVVSSNSELRRLVGQGAITYVDTNEKVRDFNAEMKPGIYKIGKHRFVRVVK